MSVFYILPSPGFLGKAFERHLHLLFPGLTWDEIFLKLLVGHVLEVTARHAGVYLIQQHELPEQEDVEQALVDGFGAEPGDELIEMHAGARMGEWRIKRRLVGG